MNNQFLNFFRELINRVATKSPRFFQLLQVVFASLSLAGYLPGVLSKYFNVELPGHTIALCSDIALFTTGFFGATLLPVKPNASAQTEEKLPYTINHEKGKEDGLKSNGPEGPV